MSIDLIEGEYVEKLKSLISIGVLKDIIVYDKECASGITSRLFRVMILVFKTNYNKYPDKVYIREYDFDNFLIDEVRFITNKIDFDIDSVYGVKVEKINDLTYDVIYKYYIEDLKGSTPYTRKNVLFITDDTETDCLLGAY